MKTIIIKIPEYKTGKIKKSLNKLINLTDFKKHIDKEPVQCSRDITAYNKAFNEYNQGNTMSIDEYLESRNIDV